MLQLHRFLLSHRLVSLINSCLAFRTKGGFSGSGKVSEFRQTIATLSLRKSNFFGTLSVGKTRLVESVRTQVDLSGGYVVTRKVSPSTKLKQSIEGYWGSSHADRRNPKVRRNFEGEKSDETALGGHKGVQRAVHSDQGQELPAGPQSHRRKPTRGVRR